MLTSPDNDLLTRTGAGTVMGEYFRRFWQPIALSPCFELGPRGERRFFAPEQREHWQG